MQAADQIEQQSDEHRNHRGVRVTVGIPVYNGELYLGETLDSVRNQTLSDFKVIISDNASTDATGNICQTYAEMDSRYTYVRSAENQGASWNFRRVFEMADGHYFVWLSHDDLWEPTFLERCVRTLEMQRDAVLCYSATRVIDDTGDVIKTIPIDERLEDQKLSRRFGAAWRFPPAIIAFSVMRRDVLAQTELIARYASADRILVAHLALLGRFASVSDYLFSYRRHANQSTGLLYPARIARSTWFDPKAGHQIQRPTWHLAKEYRRIVRETPMTALARAACYGSVARWMARNSGELLADFGLIEPRIRGFKRLGTRVDKDLTRVRHEQ